MSRRSKAWIVVAAILTLVVGMFVVADRVAVNIVDDHIAQQIRTALDERKITLASDPEVDVTGFPFLTQMVGGTYDELTVSLDRPKINGAHLLDSLQLVASSVRTSRHGAHGGAGEVTADKVTGTATLTWDAVRPLLELAGMPPGVDPAKIQLTSKDRRVLLRVPVSYAGVHAALVIQFSLIVEGPKARVRLDGVGSDNGSPRVIQDLISRYKDKLSVSIHLPAMPYNLVLNKVDLSVSGLLLSVTATHVNLVGTGP